MKKEIFDYIYPLGTVILTLFNINTELYTSDERIYEKDKLIKTTTNERTSGGDKYIDFSEINYLRGTQAGDTGALGAMHVRLNGWEVRDNRPRFINCNILIRKH